MTEKRVLEVTLTLVSIVISLAFVVRDCSSKSKPIQTISIIAPQSSPTPTAEPDYKGTTKRIVRTQPTSGSSVIAEVLVEKIQRVKGKDGFNKLFLWVTAETQFYVQNGDERTSVTLDALTEGSAIEFRITGAVMTSSPAKVVASEIVIVKK